MLVALSNIVIAIAATVLIVATLSDVFQSVIVPRAVGRNFRLSSYFWRSMWWLWPRLAWQLHPADEDEREDFLAIFAPATLVLMLAFWILLLVLAYGALFWALREQMAPPLRTFWAAVYYAGTSFTTIGYGDIVARSGLTRAISLCAGASGLGVVSVTTAYLFAIFGTFQAREQFVVMVGARAGSPPSGVGLVTVAGFANTRDDLATTLHDGQRWIATVMESHLAYPVLAYFRSSHDYESWIGTLGTLLDASVLLMTTVRDATGEARITYTLGRHAAHDLAKYFLRTNAQTTPGIDRSEFDRACERLIDAGFTLHDRDQAWDRFSKLRSTYAHDLNALARAFQIPPVQWVGDRTLIGSAQVHPAPMPH
ncbi:MAG: potassium channel family protein [Vulcanimicrobiaceae bacterium]